MSWPTVPLKRMVDPTRPITYGIVQAGPDTPNGIPYIRPVDMTQSDGVPDTEKLQRTTHEIAQSYRRSTVAAGDIVVSIGPSYGKTMVVPSALAGANLTQGTARVAPANNISTRYLYWSLQSAAAKQFWDSSVGGATFRALNLEPLGRTPVPLVPLAEQHRIADFLDAETARIDQLTAASHRQFGLINERFTESIRVLTTTAGLGEVTPTGISWMPAMASSWKLMKIGRCFATSSGTTPRSSDANYYDGPHFWVNTGDLRDGAIEQPKKTVTDTALAVYPTLKIYAPESLVVAMYGATTGRVGILKVPACVNQACCVLSELGPLSSRYAFFWFRAHREEVLKLASGGGQPNISQDLVRSLRIPAPSRYEQDEIVDQAESLESMSSRQQHLQVRRAELLAERRQSLITAAVTGQFDVSTASGRNVTDGVTA